MTTRTIQQSEAISAVVDMTCAVWLGEIAKISALVSKGYPVDTPHTEGFATMSLFEFAQRFGNDEVKTYVVTLRGANPFATAHSPSHYVPYPAGLWKQTVRDTHTPPAVTCGVSFRRQS